MQCTPFECMVVRQRYRRRAYDTKTLTRRIDACTACAARSTSAHKFIASHTEMLLRLHVVTRQWQTPPSHSPQDALTR